MTSRPQTRAQIIDLIESVLQDTSNATWSAAELGLILDDVITEVSEAVPYIMRDIYQIESRDGLSTSTSASNLVDATNAQFASGDTGKVVYNTDDRTWAVITSYSSTSQVGLSKDIFTVGEHYEIYNEGCWSKKQINIKNSSDFLWIPYAEYPADRYSYTRSMNKRNVFLHDQNKILELDVDYVDDSADTDADKDVAVYFARQHKLNPMTDLLGEIDLGAGYAAGVTSIHVDGLQATGTIFKDTLFYFTQLGGNTANSRLVYRVTADATLGTNECDVSFWPALESAVIDNDDITFVGSTLTPDLERIIVQIVAGEALMSEGLSKINVFSRGGTSTPARYYDIGERMAEKARKKLKALIDVDLRANVYSYSRG